jgi:superfamily II DNA/RNA helicase
MKFDELGLSPEVIKAVTEMGFTELTPIQEQTFVLIREGRDLVAMAETGSGKTSACGIPLAEMVDAKVPGISMWTNLALSANIQALRPLPYTAAFPWISRRPSWRMGSISW